MALALEEDITAKSLAYKFLRSWKDVIADILATRIKNKEETVLRIYDFVRAKCMYKSLEDVEYTGIKLL